MELNCFFELSGLQLTGLVALIVVGIGLCLLGVVLAFKPYAWKGRISLGWNEKRTAMAAPIACILLGLASFGIVGWYMHKTFPAENIQFSQKSWTLQEVKERLESISRTQVVLKGQAASYKLDKPFTGACAGDVLRQICDHYSTQLQCDVNSKSGVFVITTR